jgi:hypothetical protein
MVFRGREGREMNLELKNRITETGTQKKLHFFFSFLFFFFCDSTEV